MRRLSAGVAELVDAPDLGSGAARRGGSSPFTRTISFIFNVLRREALVARQLIALVRIQRSIASGQRLRHRK